MSLTINARFLTQPRSGVQRYAEEICRALDTLLVEDPAHAARLGPVRARLPAGAHRDPGWRVIALTPTPGGTGHFWEQGALARAARAEVLVSLGNSGPLLHPCQIVAFHDSHLWDMPEAYDWRYRAWHRALRPRLARRARARLTVSRHAAAGLAPRLGQPEAAFELVPNAAEHILRQPADRSALPRHGLTPGGYLFALGNSSPNKNLARLIAAHAQVPGAPPLVLAGAAAPGLANSALTRPETVRQLGRIDDASLRALMENARGFLFPSLHEGFGIPPLEAMILGVPVAAARAGALPETLGAAPLWFDPRDPGDIARAIAALLALPDRERAERRRAGQAQALRYSWHASALRLLELVAAA